MKTIKVEIEGTAPLLMHQMSIETQKEMQKKSKKAQERLTPEEEAERGAYRTEDNELYIPARAIKRALINAASWYKIGKKSAKQYIAGLVVIQPEEIRLGTNTYEIDQRPVVIQGRNRIIRSRPRLDEWTAEFNLTYDEKTFGDAEVLKEILTEAGQRIGLLDNRPQCYGENGTFTITKWEMVEK